MGSKTDDGKSYLIVEDEKGIVHCYFVWTVGNTTEFAYISGKDSSNIIVDNSPNFENLPNAINTISGGLGTALGIEEVLINNVIEDIPEAKNYLKAVKVAGNICAGINIFLTLQKASEEHQNRTLTTKKGIKYTMDIVMGVLSMTGPTGIIVSSVYFIGDILTDGYWMNDD